MSMTIDEIKNREKIIKEIEGRHLEYFKDKNLIGDDVLYKRKIMGINKESKYSFYILPGTPDIIVKDILENLPNNHFLAP